MYATVAWLVPCGSTWRGNRSPRFKLCSNYIGVVPSLSRVCVRLKVVCDRKGGADRDRIGVRPPSATPQMRIAADEGRTRSVWDPVKSLSVRLGGLYAKFLMARWGRG